MGNSSPILILFRMGMAGSGIKSEKMGRERGMFTSGQDKSLRTNKVHQENMISQKNDREEIASHIV